MTLTGSLSSVGGAWLVVGLAPTGEVVRGEAARGKCRAGPGLDDSPISSITLSDTDTASSSGMLMFSFD